jgi:hypothetical protein
LDEDAVLNSYYEGKQLHEQETEKEDSEKSSRSAIPKKVRNLIYFVSLFVILLAVLIVIYLILQKDETDIPIRTQQTPAAYLNETPSPPEFAEQEIEELRFVVTFDQLTWIQVFADGELRLAGNIEPGETFQIVADKELRIETGNAGGFHYTLNGKTGKPVGPPGTVRDVLITLENMDTFTDETEVSDPEIKNI